MAESRSPSTRRLSREPTQLTFSSPQALTKQNSKANNVKFASVRLKHISPNEEATLVRGAAS